MQALKGIGVSTDRIRMIINRWHKGDEETLKSHSEENQTADF